jgi:two-component system, cell cycle response regulator DivK
LEDRHGSTPTVLLVEDSDDTRLVIRGFLETNGYRVVEASDGREAIEAARHNCPDLILMDLNLPSLDGLAATEEIRACRETCRQPPVIALTAYDVYGMRQAALEAGCCEYLTKPLDFDLMAKTISRMLGA